MQFDDLQTDDDGTIAKEPDQTKFNTLKEWATADIDWSSKWRARAKRNFEFMTNEGQWDEADRDYLKDEKRPIVTFNLTNKFVKAICGLEANNRHETVYLPRELDNEGEVQANEVLTAGSRWMGDNCHADRHQSRAFRDLNICGMGWTEQSLSFDDDPKGEYVESRCDPLEMIWDRNSRDQNLMDSKRRGRVRKMLLSEARALIPGVTDNEDEITDSDLDAWWAGDVFDLRSDETKTQEEKERRDEAKVKGDPKREVHIVQLQWWEYEPYWLAYNPQTGKNEPMSDEDFSTLKDAAAKVGQKIPGVRMRRKKYMQAFLGDKILAVGDCPRPDGFTFQCMTGEPEDTTGYWMSMVDILRDPAMWSNKLMSQALHMLNSTAKGGIVIEDDAVSDVNDFTKNYAKSEQVSVVRQGTIAKGKIMAKPGVANLNGVLQLYEIAKVSFQDVSGLNLELMGLADRQQPGVLEAQRKQAAMSILATLFDSLALFRVEVGKTRMHFLQTVLSDGRLIRVAGDDAQRAIPLIRDRVMGKYDVIVEDAPTSPNTKEKTWATIQMLLPPLLKAGMVSPKMVLMLLDYVPFLPSKLVQTLKKISAEPNPEAEKAKMLEDRRGQAEIEKIEADTDLSEQKASRERTGAILDLVNAGSEVARVEAEQQAAEMERLYPQGTKNEATEQPEQPSPQTMPRLPVLGEGPPPLPQQAGAIDQIDAEPELPGIALPGGLNGR